MEKGRRSRLMVLISFILFVFFAAAFASTVQHKDGSMKHFVLVHGATLGAWSWYKLVPLLQSSGHRVTAIDLAASGINPLQYNEIHSFSNYSQPLIDFMASLPTGQRVILVGHSFGGAAVAQMMELFPQKVSVGVFLTAVMPGPSLSLSVIQNKIFSAFATALDNELIYDDGPNNAPTAFLFGPKYLSEVVYQYSPPEDAALAIMLARPLRVISDLDIFSEPSYRNLPMIYIIAEKDQVLPAEMQKWIIRKNPPNKVLKIGGSDHMVMASKPLQLLAHLLDIARDYS